MCQNSNGLFDNIIGCINKGTLFEAAVKLNINTQVFSQKYRGDFKIASDIKEYIQKNNIDIINFHGANPNFIYLFLKNRISIPCVTTIHSDYRYDFTNNVLKYVFFTPLNIIALKGFKNFICVSSIIEELLNKKGFSGKKYVVNNGVDINYSITESRASIRAKYNIHDDAFVYTMVARMHPVKNHLRLIEAAAMLAGEYRNIRLLLVGSGDYEDKVRLKVKELNVEDNVIFTGKQERPLDFINAGDINILTSLNETFPLVILEGALVKKAAICTNVGDIKRIVNRATGFIVDANSVDDISMKMKEAFTKKHILPQMGNALYDIVVKEYSVEKFCERYYYSYNDILTGGNNG